MGLNITGQEVATGIYDPMVMFYTVAGIFAIGILVIVIYTIYNFMR